MKKTIHIETAENERVSRYSGVDIEPPRIGETILHGSDYYEVLDVCHDPAHGIDYDEEEMSRSPFDIWVIVEPTDRDWWD